MKQLNLKIKYSLNFSEEEKLIYETFMLKSKCDPSLIENIDVGYVLVPGSHLPSNSNKEKSLISGRLVEVNNI